MILTAPDQVITDLLDALGLDPKRTRSVCLVMEPSRPVIVEVESYVSQEHLGQFALVARRYRLVPVEAL